MRRGAKGGATSEERVAERAAFVGGMFVVTLFLPFMYGGARVVRGAR